MKVMKAFTKVLYILGASLLVLALALAGCTEGDLTQGEATSTPEATERPTATQEPSPGLTEEPTGTEEPTTPGLTPGTTRTPGLTPGTQEPTTPGLTPGTEQPGAALTVQVTQDPELGAILTDGGGMTLYLLEADQPGTSTCYDACATLWPPLLADGQPTAGEGVDASLLGTTQRDDGQMQVTYNDWPIYYYTPDVEPGDVNGHQVTDAWGLWLVISPEGEPVQ